MILYTFNTAIKKLINNLKKEYLNEDFYLNDVGVYFICNKN